MKAGFIGTKLPFALRKRSGKGAAKRPRRAIKIDLINVWKWV